WRRRSRVAAVSAPKPGCGGVGVGVGVGVAIGVGVGVGVTSGVVDGMAATTSGVPAARQLFFSRASLTLAFESAQARMRYVPAAIAAGITAVAAAFDCVLTLSALTR